MERAIKTAIWRKDFVRVRKLASSFKREERKAQALEEINVAEAKSLIERKELLEAERLIGKLNQPNNLTQTSAALMWMAVANKAQTQARAVAHEAVARLKKFDEATPASSLISALALSTAEVDAALDLLDELVGSLNRRSPDAQRGAIGFNQKAFVQLASADEVRVQQTARNITDRLQRITALASIYGRKVTELARAETSGATGSGQ